MKKIIMLFLLSHISFSQNSAYQQLNPLQGNVSDMFYNNQRNTISSAKEILIYGGQNHKTFLGCINCTNTAQNSIWNKYSKYGNKFSNVSIWNKYSEFGGEYSKLSPFNKYATTPPILVDNNGNFYGYFTANNYQKDRAVYKLADLIIDFNETISEDVEDLYQIIFNGK